MRYILFGSDYSCNFFLQILHSLVQKTVVGNHEFCVVVNPYDKTGKPMLGQRVLRRGVTSFFLRPGNFSCIMYQKGIVLYSIIVNETEANFVTANQKRFSTTNQNPGW